MRTCGSSHVANGIGGSRVRELATRRLFADALAGRIDRRTVLRRAAALGVSAPVAAALAQETDACRAGV